MLRFRHNEIETYKKVLKGRVKKLTAFLQNYGKAIEQRGHQIEAFDYFDAVQIIEKLISIHDN